MELLRSASWDRLGFAVDAFLLGALLAAVTDWLVSTPSGTFSLIGLLFVLVVAATASIVLAAAAWGGAQWSALLDRRLRDRWPGVASAAGCLALISPLLYASWRLASTPGVALLVLAVTALLFGCVAVVIGKRVGSPTAWLVACCGGGAFVFLIARSLLLFRRVAPDRIAIHLLLLLGGTGAAIVLAFAGVQLIQACKGLSTPRPLRGGAAVVGVGLMAATTQIGPHCPTTRRGMLLAVITFAALGMSQMRLPRIVRLLGVGATLVGSGYLVLVSSPLSELRTSLVAHSVIAREVLEGTNALKWRMLRETARMLKTEPARRGAGLKAEAVAWNRESSRLSGRFRRASVLLITIDTLRFDHAGYSGRGPRGLTPAIDRLAARSYRFHRCRAQGGWTSLSLPSMMWSRYPSEIELASVFETADSRLVMKDEVTGDDRIEREFLVPVAEPHVPLAMLLTRAGFRTVAVPHDGYTKFFSPRLDGFSKGFTQVIYPQTIADQRGRATPTDDRFAVDLAIEQLEGHDFQVPLFLWIHIFEPHRPLGTAPEKNRFAGYRGDLHYADQQLGRLLRAVDGLPPSTNVVIALAGDHGEALGERGQHGHGLSLYDEAVRVPLLLALPGHRGKDIDQPVGLIDIAPTLLDLAGVEIPKSMHGFKLTHILDASPSRQRPPVLLETWHTWAGTDGRSIDQIGIVHQRRKVVVDWASWAFHYRAILPAGERPLPMLEGQRPVARFDRLAATLLGWYCSVHNPRNEERCR